MTQEAGLTDELASVTALWFDCDRDGFLDLYVTNGAAVLVDFFAANPIENWDPSVRNRLYRNNRDGTFTATVNLDPVGGVVAVRRPGNHGADRPILGRRAGLDALGPPHPGRAPGPAQPAPVRSTLPGNKWRPWPKGCD